MLGLLLDAAMPLPLLHAEREIVIDMMKDRVRFCSFPRSMSSRVHQETEDFILGFVQGTLSNPNI